MSIGSSRIYIVRWKDIDKWIIPRTSLVTKLPLGWSSPAIRDLVKPVTHREKVESDKEYKMVGVRWYGEGLFHRETVQGSNLSSKWVTPVVPNAFIYNRLFAWKESFAVVPNEYNGYHVSSEFPQFIVDESIILPKYLYLIFTRRKVIEVVKKLSVGSSAVSRNRFKEQEFISLHIPLPPLSTQFEIVKFYEKTRQEALRLVEQSKEKESEVDDTLASQIGIEGYSVQRRKGAFVAHFKALERWDVSFHTYETNHAVSFKSTQLKDAIETIDKQRIIPSKTEKYWYIGLENIEKDTGEYRPREATNGQIRSSSILLKDGYIYYAKLRPYLNKVILFKQGNEKVIATTELYGFKLKDGFNPRFVQYILLSKIVQGQVERLLIGARMPRISEKDIKALRIPIVPLSRQNELVDEIDGLKAQILELKTRSQNLLAALGYDLGLLISGEKLLGDLDGQE